MEVGNPFATSLLAGSPSKSDHVRREHVISPTVYTVYITAHYCDVIMVAIASQITSLTIVYSMVYSGADQRKRQSSASLVFVRRIHRWPINYMHRWLVTRKMFSFDDVIIYPSEVYIRLNDVLCLSMHLFFCKLLTHINIMQPENAKYGSMCGITNVEND